MDSINQPPSPVNHGHWTPATYRIARRNGDSDVTGVRLGVFGVGPSVNEPGWQVTHLPTGLGVRPAFASESQAQRFAEGLIDLRDDWPRVTRHSAFGAHFGAALVALERRVRDGRAVTP